MNRRGRRERRVREERKDKSGAKLALVV